MARTGVVGDFRELYKLQKKISGLASREFRYELAVTLAQEARSQILRGFQEQRDPYGKPWKPTKKHRRGPSGKTLVDRAILRNSIAPRDKSAVPGTYAVSPKGFSIGTNVRYAAIHQYGGIIHRKPQTLNLRFNKRGRFVKKSRKAAREIQRTTKAYTITIPRRQYLPEGDLGSIWGKAFKRQGKAVLRSYVKGR